MTNYSNNIWPKKERLPKKERFTLLFLGQVGQENGRRLF